LALEIHPARVKDGLCTFNFDFDPYFHGLETSGLLLSRSTHPVSYYLRSQAIFIDDLLRLQDDGSKIPFAGLFLYTQNMPAMMLTNTCTLLGQVNGATGTAVGIAVDPTGTFKYFLFPKKTFQTASRSPSLPPADFLEIDATHVMCTKPPACVLFKPDTCRASTFEDLDPAITPIFPFEKSISWKGYSIRRRQAPMCPAFCLTQYKVQGLSLKNAILQLNAEPRRTEHEKCTSNYVQLGRLETSEGVHLLEKIEMSDLLFKPDPRLLAEMNHIRELERLTLARWCGDGSSE
jgi:hypothetical protein